LPTGS